MKTLLHSTALTLATVTLAGAAGAQVNLTAATSSPGSTPHLAITHLATVAGQRGIASLQVAEGQTLTNSILDVAQGRTDISAAPMLLPFLLSRGMGPFSAQGEEGAAIAANLRALYPYNAGSFNVLTLETSGIETWEDLRGRTVFNGPPRGAALTNARQAITLTTGMQDGTDYEGHQANWGQLASLLVDGSMDAFVVPTTHPSDRVNLLASAGNVVVISVPQETYESEAFQRIFQMPGNIPIEIEWDSIGYGDNVRLSQSEDGILRGMGTAFADVVNADMDYQLAYDLTTAHIETLDDLIASAPFARTGGFGVVDQRLSGFCGNNQLLYHPGAVAAWEDHGYDIPDCAEGQ